MIKILGVKFVWSVWSDTWCGDESFNEACRCCVDGVVYRLELFVGDVWTVWYTLAYHDTTTADINYEGWNFNSGNYLFTSDTK